MRLCAPPYICTRLVIMIRPSHTCRRLSNRLNAAAPLLALAPIQGLYQAAGVVAQPEILNILALALRRATQQAISKTLGRRCTRLHLVASRAPAPSSHVHLSILLTTGTGTGPHIACGTHGGGLYGASIISQMLL